MFLLVPLTALVSSLSLSLSLSPRFRFYSLFLVLSLSPSSRILHFVLPVLAPPLRVSGAHVLKTKECWRFHDAETHNLFMVSVTRACAITHTLPSVSARGNFMPIVSRVSSRSPCCSRFVSLSLLIFDFSLSYCFSLSFSLRFLYLVLLELDPFLR